MRSGLRKEGRDVRLTTPNALAISICLGALLYSFAGYLGPVMRETLREEARLLCMGQ